LFGKEDKNAAPIFYEVLKTDLLKNYLSRIFLQSLVRHPLRRMIRTCTSSIPHLWFTILCASRDRDYIDFGQPRQSQGGLRVQGLLIRPLKQFDGIVEGH